MINYEILKNLVIQEIKLRYKGRVLGFTWGLLYPFLIFLVLYIVFSRIFSEEVESYAFFLLIGVIIWKFFIAGTLQALKSIVMNLDVIKRVLFPRSLLVISSVLTAFLDTVCEVLILILFFLFFTGLPWGGLLWLVPVIITELIIVSGMGLFLAYLYFRFRDVLPAWQVFLQAGFFLTPIFYPVSRVPEKYITLYMFNPVTVLIETARAGLAGEPVNKLMFFSMALVSVVFFTAVFYWFRSVEKGFARGI